MIPWKQVRIIELGEPLVEVSPNVIARADPHPYTDMGAQYPNGTSPFMLRKGAAERLVQAQYWLDSVRPGYRLSIFDAYRPITVQKQMRRAWAVDFARRKGLAMDCFNDARAALSEAAKNWANPDTSLLRPPPHSTGGSVDLYLLDKQGNAVDMGTPVDADGPQIAMDHFASAVDPAGQTIHANRMLLKRALSSAGFEHNTNEWWHFDFGNQRWAYARQQQGHSHTMAFYGRYQR